MRGVAKRVVGRGRRGFAFRTTVDMMKWLGVQSELHGLSRSQIVRRILSHHMKHSKHRGDMRDVLFGK